MKKFSFLLLIISIIFSFTSCQDESDGTKSFKVLAPGTDSVYGYEVSDVSLCMTKAIKDNGETFTFNSSIGATFNADNLGTGRYLVNSYAYDSSGTLIASTEDFKISTDRTDSFSYDLQLIWNEAGKAEGRYCIIKFNTHGGSAVEAQKIKSGEYISQPETPTRKARLFDGWYYNSSLTNSVDFSQAVSCNLTLHAKWEIDPSAIQRIYYVSESGNDSSGEGTESNPYATISKAVSEINGYEDSEIDYTIYITGSVTGNPSIGTLYANSLTIAGSTGSDTDIIDGNNSGMAISFGSGISSDVTLKNLTVQNGTGRYGAGVRYLGSGLLTVNSCVIQNNRATGTETNSDGSTANANGGGIVLQNGSLSLVSTSVINNYSQYNAGGIYFNGSTFTIDSGTTIIGNEAGYSGGGVSVTGGTFNMGAGSIHSNKALKGGGVIVQSAGTLNMSGGAIEQNEVYTDSSTSYSGMGTGGGILVNDGVFTMTGGVIDSNISESNGAGVYINKGTVSMTGGTITNNSSTTGLGGGVYNNNSANHTMDGATLAYNSAKKGGGLVVAKGTTQIYSGSITQNTCSNSGAGVYVDQGTFIINGGSISENTSTAHGGGVFVDRRTGTDIVPGSFYMNGGIIESNKAGVSGEKSGGGVYLKGIFTMTGGSISSNTASYAAGVWNNDTGIFTMTGGSIESNISSGNGGGLGTSGTTILEGGSILNNTAAGRGGGIFAAASLSAGGTAVVVGGSSGTNTIHLKSDVVLNFTGELTGEADSRAVITCSNYAVGVQVFTESEDGAIAINCTKFEVESPDSATAWFISSKGTLYALDNSSNQLITGQTVTVDSQEYQQVSLSTATELSSTIDMLMQNEIDTSNVCITLDSDITLDSSYTPYGYESSTGTPASITSFEGVFDGGGNTITVTALNANNFNPICRKNYGIIQNIRITSTSSIATTEGSSSGYNTFGGICFDNYGTIRNCQVDYGTVTIQLFNRSGAICVNNCGTIENCVNTTTLVCSFNKNNWSGRYGTVGGICAVNYGGGVIKNCVNYGQITLPTTYTSGDSINGIPGAICGMQEENSSIQNCYWRKDCIYTDTAQTSTANNMVFNSTVTGVRDGTFTGNGWFESNTDGSLTAGTSETSGTEQTLEYGTDLLSALNSCSSTDSNLCNWVSSSDYAAVLNIAD